MARMDGMPARKECPDTEVEEKSMKPFSHDFNFLLNKAGVRFLPEASLKAGRRGWAGRSKVNLENALTGHMSLPVG